jgi:hypothetical protein
MPGVGQPQRRFLAMLFSTILALRGRVNFRNLSRYCAYSERTIARQFRRAFAWPTLHQHVIQTARAPEAAVSAAQDASCIPKSGQQTFGLGHFFNGCTSRPERGLEIATLAVVDVTRRGACTLAVAQPPPGEGRAPDAQEETRMDFSLPTTARASSASTSTGDLSPRGRRLGEATIPRRSYAPQAAPDDQGTV